MTKSEYWNLNQFNLEFQNSIIIRQGSYSLCKSKQKELERIEFYRKYKNYFKIYKN
jgi:hypothetical protein